MTYLKRSKRPNRQAGKAAVAIAGLVVVFAINFFFPRFFPTVFYPVTSVLMRGESSSVGFFVSMGEIVRSKYSLIKENRRLEEEVAARDRSLLRLDALERENESLKSAFDRSGKGDYVLGVILSRPPVSLYDTLVVDVGSRDGVKVGNKVYAEGDVLIGDVEEVFGSQAKVSLFSAPGRVMSVLVGTSTVAAEATGRGNGNFVTKLPSGSKISQGATVALPHIHSHIFGVVGSVTLDSSASVQTIFFNSPVNIHQLAFVEIDRNSFIATSSAPSATKPSR